MAHCSQGMMKLRAEWLGYFDDLLNIENEREDLEGILPVQGPIEEIYLEEVITQIGKMKKIKHVDRIVYLSR